FSRDILRGKGIIHFTEESRPMVWQQTGRHIDISPVGSTIAQKDIDRSRLIVIAPDEPDAVSGALCKIGFSPYSAGM
ncbi:MAG: GTP-binding protein, partial [Parvularculales bacterium]